MADAGTNYANALSGIGDDIANAMYQYHREHQAHDTAYGVADALSRIGIDKTTGQPVQVQFDEKGKPVNAENIQMFGNPRAIEAYKSFNRQNAAASEGALNAISRLVASGLTRAQASAIEDASLSGQRTKQVIEQEKQMFPIEMDERKARTAETKARAQSIQAEANQPTLELDIGDGNRVRVSAADLIHHPDFLKNVKPKEVNDAVFNSTGMTLPQVQQSWNKRVVNGQFQFDVPVPVTKPNPINGAPVPMVDANNKPIYEQIPNPKYDPNSPISETNSKTITRTSRFNIPPDLTPDVLRIIGTEGVTGSNDDIKKMMKAPSKQVGGVGVVPNSVQVPQTKASEQDIQTVSALLQAHDPNGTSTDPKIQAARAWLKSQQTGP